LDRGLAKLDLTPWLPGVELPHFRDALRALELERLERTRVPRLS
jgi:hypothetical protein